MATYAVLEVELPTGHTVQVEPPLVSWNNALKDVGRARGAIMEQYVLPAIKRKYPEYGVGYIEWNRGFFTLARTEVKAPRRRTAHPATALPVSTHRATTPIATLAPPSYPDSVTDDGDPNCTCDTMSRCSVHDERGA